MRLPPRSCFLVVTVLPFQCYCTSEERSFAARVSTGGPTAQRTNGTQVQDVYVGGGGRTRVACAKTSRCVGAVRLGPVSDTPSLGGVGTAGCTITSPWALCNYALT